MYDVPCAAASGAPRSFLLSPIPNPHHAFLSRPGLSSPSIWPGLLYRRSPNPLFALDCLVLPCSASCPPQPLLDGDPWLRLFATSVKLVPPLLSPSSTPDLALLGFPSTAALHDGRLSRCSLPFLRHLHLLLFHSFCWEQLDAAPTPSFPPRNLPGQVSPFLFYSFHSLSYYSIRPYFSAHSATCLLNLTTICLTTLPRR
jgi:hypothetical protein